MPGSIPLAVIGGSGFYEMPGLGSTEDISIETPYGPTSSVIRTGEIGGTRVAFLARHGEGHRLLPSELPQRANFWALKQLGVERVLAVSAVGSLREDYAPGHLVTPDQLIDRTHGTRPATFFGSGVVAHVSFAEPFCAVLRGATAAASASAGAETHKRGTYVVIEGPAFGTRAEGELQRGWGASIVGMTALPEAKLAREAELCYALLAAVTDYDAGLGEHEAVDARTVFDTLKRNVTLSQDVVRELVRMLPERDGCGCGTALDAALVTDPEAIDEEARRRLGPILQRRLGVTG